MIASSIELHYLLQVVFTAAVSCHKIWVFCRKETNHVRTMFWAYNVRRVHIGIGSQERVWFWYEMGLTILWVLLLSLCNHPRSIGIMLAVRWTLIIICYHFHLKREVKRVKEREREKKRDKRRVGQDEEGGREERRGWELRTISKTHAGKVSEWGLKDEHTFPLFLILSCLSQTNWYSRP